MTLCLPKVLCKLQLLWYINVSVFAADYQLNLKHYFSNWKYKLLSFIGANDGN